MQFKHSINNHMLFFNVLIWKQSTDWLFPLTVFGAHLLPLWMGATPYYLTPPPHTPPPSLPDLSVSSSPTGWSQNTFKLRTSILFMAAGLQDVLWLLQLSRAASQPMLQTGRGGGGHVAVFCSHAHVYDWCSRSIKFMSLSKYSIRSNDALNYKVQF